MTKACGWGECRTFVSPASLVYAGGVLILVAALPRWGELSYPLYQVHFPFLYVYYAWVKNGSLSFLDSLPGAVALVVGSILLATAALYLYDRPVRRWLSDSGRQA